jgi:hypothetical protein
VPDAEARAIAAWNRRAVPVSETQTARAEALREAADKCDAWAEISALLGRHDARTRAFEDAAANIRALATLLEKPHG